MDHPDGANSPSKKNKNENGGGKGNDNDINVEVDNHQDLSTDQLIARTKSYLDTLEKRILHPFSSSPQVLHQHSISEFKNIQERAQILSSFRAAIFHSQNLVSTGAAQGFIYGIIDRAGKPLSAASDKLRSWWETETKFDQNGPAAVYLLSKEESSEPLTLKSLACLHDTTLSSLISCLMQRCKPPQRSRPFEKGVPVEWWPTGKEEWWGELMGLIGKEVVEPPVYKKPHDLRKVWKLGILTAVIKNISPDFEGMRRAVAESKMLHKKMSSKENDVWLGVIRGEELRYMGKSNVSAAKNGDDIKIEATPRPRMTDKGQSSKRGGGEVCYEAETAYLIAGEGN